MPSSEPFSIRLPQDVYDRVFSVIAATGGEITRTDLITRAVRTYLAVLPLNPGMVEGYDPKRDASVTSSPQA